MTLLKWIWAEDDQGHVSPEAVYYTLRIVMFILSFVLEDWAIYELVHSPRHRRQAVFLVASSYVTWTYQSHTFSNSVETLLVAWSLVLIERIVREKVGCLPSMLPDHQADCLQNHSVVLSCGILAFIIVFGVFNRITFPAFLLIPGLQLLPHVLSRQVIFVDDFIYLLTNQLQTIFLFEHDDLSCRLHVPRHRNRHSVLPRSYINTFFSSPLQEP